MISQSAFTFQFWESLCLLSMWFLHSHHCGWWHQSFRSLGTIFMASHMPILEPLVQRWLWCAVELSYGCPLGHLVESVVYTLSKYSISPMFCMQSVLLSNIGMLQGPVIAFGWLISVSGDFHLSVLGLCVRSTVSQLVWLLHGLTHGDSRSELFSFFVSDNTFV